MSAQARQIGKSGLTVAPIGLGCMSFSGAYGASDDANALRAIHHALDLGVTHLDSSDMYGWGHNEELLKKALAGGRRDKVMLATKFGQTQQPGGANGTDGSPDYVIKACEASLKRLGVEVIDLYYQHRVDPAVPIEETVGAMGRLVAQGKVRFLGLSEAAPETIRRAHATHPIAAVQTEYSLLYREAAEATLAVTRPLGIGFVAYSPLQRGTLTAEISKLDDLAENDRRREHPRFAAENLASNVRLRAPLEALAAKVGATPAQVSIAWVLSRGDDIVPIPGTSKSHRLDENLATLAKSISKADLDALGAAIDSAKVAGTRYPGGQMKTIGI